MKFVKPHCLSPKAKAIVAALFVSAASANLDKVKDWLMPLVAHHPLVSFEMSCLFGVSTLVTNPEVQKAVKSWGAADPQ